VTCGAAAAPYPPYRVIVFARDNTRDKDNEQTFRAMLAEGFQPANRRAGSLRLKRKLLITRGKEKQGPLFALLLTGLPIKQLPVCLDETGAALK
jgi:hypothetical protein